MMLLSAKNYQGVAPVKTKFIQLGSLLDVTTNTQMISIKGRIKVESHFTGGV